MAYAGQPKILKWYNKDLIERLIAENGPITKPELVTMTKLSLPTVNKIVEELKRQGIVVEGDLQESNGAGRKAKTYTINGNSGAILLVCYANGKWIGKASDMLGNDIAAAELEIYMTGSLAVLYELIDYLIKAVKNTKIIGIGIPGVVLGNGTISSIPAIPEFDGIYLGKLISEKYKVQAVVENDVKLMTLGYFSREMPTIDNMAFVYVGKRIGAGLIINGQLYKGSNSFAGEFGYMPATGIDDADTELFRNGGNLETTLAESRETGNYSRFYRCIAAALASCATVLNPEAIVLYSDEPSILSIKDIERELRRYLPDYGVPHLYITEDSSYEAYGLYKLCNEAGRNECWLSKAVAEKNNNYLY